jgi:cysteinyl-tRNA synthetase
LWKAWDDADGDVAWDSPWGKGRPGWHIECSAMSMKYLGESFDIHTGGVDNMFPHHEDEIAQSESATGKKWVNYWLHCEHLMVDGTKMSKSLGNFYTLRDLAAKGWTGREIRWVLVGAHYRKKLNFTLDALAQARETLGKFDALFDRLRGVDAAGDGSETAELIESTRNAFAAALADDLNIAPALAAAFDLTRGANRLADENKLSRAGAEKILACFRDFDRVIACFEVDAVRETATIPAEVTALAEARAAARKAKNFGFIQANGGFYSRNMHLFIDQDLRFTKKDRRR